MKCAFVPESMQVSKAGEDHFPSLSPNKKLMRHPLAVSTSGGKFRAGGGPGLQQSSTKHKNIQAGRIWWGLFHVMASPDMCWVAPQLEWRAALAVWGMQLRNLWGNTTFPFAYLAAVQRTSVWSWLGEKAVTGKGKRHKSKVPNPFWSCPVRWELSLTFFPVSYFQMDVLNPISQTQNGSEQHEISQKAAGNWEFWSWSN